MNLLLAIEWTGRRRLLVLAAGVGLEVLALLLIGSNDEIKGIRGIGGETAALLAVVGAVFAGPLVGAAMAGVGWALFFPLVAHSHTASVVALPEWAGAAILTGWLSSSLVEANRARAVADRERAAAHALRSPIATIHGLVEILAARDHKDEVDMRIIGSIEDETERLLRSEVFESHRRTN